MPSNPELGQETDPRSKEDDGAFMAKVRDRYNRAREREEDNMNQAYEDLSFRAGENQWDERVKNERITEQRPVLVFNEVPQFVKQITGGIRQMRPAIKVVAVDDAADPETADHMSGMVRYIENRSDAKDAYFKGADSQAAAGIGHWRVLTEYASESTFEQEIRISAVEDGVAVLWDPDAHQPTREDGEFCFVPVDLSIGAYKNSYPNASISDFGPSDWKYYNDWKTDNHVRIAEYWEKVPVMRNIVKLPNENGFGLYYFDDLDDEVKAQIDPSIITQRRGYQIWRYLVSGGEVLEWPTEPFPSRFIPIVPVIGEEVRIGRRIIRHGIVRFMRDPQRVYNYNLSCQTEVVALQPKAPWMVTEKNVAKHQKMWETANQKSWPYLVYEPDAKNQGRQPARVAPPVSSQGIENNMVTATNAMHRVTGIHPPSLGQQSNETSGKAIIARQREGDESTFVYVDNFSRSVNHTGRILVDMIPKIYDTERSIRILGEDGRVESIRINQVVGEDNGEEKVQNDVTVGSYDVVTMTGPSYNTKREEAREGMKEFVTAAPNVAPLIIDLLAKSQDWPLADEIAARARATIPAPILEAAEREMGIGRGDGSGESEDAPVQEEEEQTPTPEEIEAAKAADIAEKEVERVEMELARDKDLAEQKVQQAELQTKILQEELALTQAKLSSERQKVRDKGIEQLQALNGEGSEAPAS